MKPVRKGKFQFYLLTFVIVLIFILPVVWMVSSSLKDNNAIFKVPPELLPIPPKWSNYIEAVTYIPFFLYFKNTMIIAVLSALGVIITTPFVAYAFSRMEWRGRDALFILSLSTLMLPFQVQMIPLYVMYRQVGWIGTLLPLIVPNFFGNALFIFLLRQFMIGIPEEITEAALIDGAGHFTILTRVLLPLCKPAILTIGLFEFLGVWTDFPMPLVFLNNTKLYTLSLGLQQYSSVHQTQWSYLMAASVLYTIPVLVLFFFTQKSFVKGITFTGIKG